MVFVWDLQDARRRRLVLETECFVSIAQCERTHRAWATMKESAPEKKRKGKERKGKERKGKERKGKERPRLFRGFFNPANQGREKWPKKLGEPIAQCLWLSTQCSEPPKSSHRFWPKICAPYCASWKKATKMVAFVDQRRAGVSKARRLAASCKSRMLTSQPGHFHSSASAQRSRRSGPASWRPPWP